MPSASDAGRLFHLPQNGPVQRRAGPGECLRQDIDMIGPGDDMKVDGMTGVPPAGSEFKRLVDEFLRLGPGDCDDERRQRNTRRRDVPQRAPSLGLLRRQRQAFLLE